MDGGNIKPELFAFQDHGFDRNAHRVLVNTVERGVQGAVSSFSDVEVEPKRLPALSVPLQSPVTFWAYAMLAMSASAAIKSNRRMNALLPPGTSGDAATLHELSCASDAIFDVMPLIVK